MDEDYWKLKKDWELNESMNRAYQGMFVNSEAQYNQVCQEKNKLQEEVEKLQQMLA